MTVVLDASDAVQAKPRKSKVTLTVVAAPRGVAKSFQFDERPLSEQLERVCELFHLYYDAEENYYVLTRGPGPASPAITSEAALLCLPSGSQVCLRSGTELVQERMLALKCAKKGNLAAPLRGLCGIFCGDAWISEEVIDCHGIGALLDATSLDPEITEVAAAGLCELFQYPSAVTWLGGHQARLNVHLFHRLFSVLFNHAGANSDGGGDEARRRLGITPRATLCMCIFLLYMFPDAVDAAHAAANGEEGTSGSLYQRIVEAAEGCGDEFQVAAAVGLFSAMGIAAGEKPWIAGKIQDEVVGAAADSAEGEEFFAQCQRPEHFSERLLEMWMGSCSAMVLRQGESQGIASTANTNSQDQETRIHRLQEVNEQLKAKLRHQHQTMCAMVPFMKVENSALVAKSLDGIIRLGWESLHWAQGYSLMHYVAETCDDPQIVELVGLLAADQAIDARDDFGKRPIDYARPRLSRAPGVVKVIEKLRRDERRRTKQESSAAKQVSEPLLTKLAQLKDLAPALQQAIEAVLKVGWDRVNWPNRFTAMHLAARSGHVGAVELLAASKGDLSACDDWKLTPLDYAAQGGHQDVITTLQRLLDQEGKAPTMTSATGSKTPRSLASVPDSTDSFAAQSPSSGKAFRGKSATARRKNSSDSAAPKTGRSERRGSSADAGLVRSAKNSSITEPPSSQGRPGESLAVPSGLRPELKQACEAVLRKGWAKIQWPHHFTALHLAAKLGHMEAVSFLLSASASPALAIPDDRGQAPLDYARKAGNPALVELLERSLRSGGYPSLSDRPRSRAPTSAASPGGLADADPQRAAQWTAVQASVANRVEEKLRQTGRGGKDLHRQAEPEDMGLELLRAEVTRLRQQRDALDAERQRWLATTPAGALAGATAGPSGPVPAAGVLGGPLDEPEIIKFLKHMETVGRDKVYAKLQDSAFIGGLEFTDLDAQRAMDQLDLVRRCAPAATATAPCSTAPFSTAPSSTAPLPDGTPVDKALAAASAAETAGSQASAAAAAAEKHAKAGLGAEVAAAAARAAKAAVNAAMAAKRAAEAAGGPPAVQDESSPAPKAGGKGGTGSKEGPPAPGGEGPALPGKDGDPESLTAGGKGPSAKGGKKSEKGGKGHLPTGGKGKGPPTPDAPGGKAPSGKNAGKSSKADGGGAARGGAESKPERVPRVPMKPIWWTKFVFGVHLQRGQTIWDHVEDEGDVLPIDVLEGRFAKNAVVTTKAEKVEKAEEVKFLRIITDTHLLAGKEAALKHLPSPHQCAKALEELDDELLSLDALRIMRENATPTSAQMQQLVEERKKNPNLPLAVPEQFMWVIGNLPAYQQRMDCWTFIRTYDERQVSYRDALEDFDRITDCFRDSETLPKLLGLILATGNYLNGGTSRGQADGFDIDTLSKLDSVKDNANKDIRHFIFHYFFHNWTREAEALLQDLASLVSNVNRRLAKDADGTEKLNKSTRYAYEDFDQCVVALKAELDERFETMKMIMQYFDDPADQFRMRMPGAFSKAKESIEDLVKLKESVQDKYGKLLGWFKIQGMKSSDFCLVWDALLVPGDLILNKPDKMKKELLVPTFCRNKPFGLEELMVLWEFKEPDDDAKRKKRERRGRGGRRASLAPPDGAFPAMERRASLAGAGKGERPRGKGRADGRGRGKAGGRAPVASTATDDAATPAALAAEPTVPAAAENDGAK